MKTTLNKIRKHKPCKSGWEKLLTYLGKTKADDEPLAITTVLDSNGLDDALWCLKAVEGKDKEIRLYAVWCARQVQHLMTDQRSIDVLDIAERYANGEATEEELLAAREAVWFARSSDSAIMAGAAHSAANRCSARTVGWSASAAGAAARAAAYDSNEMRARQEAELRRICEEG